MSTAPVYDVAVVGLGAAGSATLLQLARRGLKVIGIDRHAPPHAFGSSHGETRITRRAIGEGLAYVPLAIRSHELWRELEAETGACLLREVGCLILSRRDDAAIRPLRTGFVERTREAAETFGIAHEILSGEDVARRFPQFATTDENWAYYEPDAGYLHVEACLQVQLQRAAQLGATLALGQTVTGIDAAAGGVTLRTSDGPVMAGEVVVSAGPWAPALLGPPFDTLLQPSRQMMHWLPLTGARDAQWRNGPTFIWPHGAGVDDFFYGLPTLDGTSIKMAEEAYDPPVDPDRVDRNIAAADHARMSARHAAGRLIGVGQTAVRAVTCLYTNTPDGAFLIDRHPAFPHIHVVSACSGHGFKHSAAIGEAMAQIITGGESAIPLSAFALGRFAHAPS